jgi:hypothetical protein
MGSFPFPDTVSIISLKFESKVRLLDEQRYVTPCVANLMEENGEYF